MTADSVGTTRHTDHPAPHRAQASMLSLAVGLGLAPLAWFLELAIDTTLLSQACFPRDVPFVGSVASSMSIVLAVDAAALVLTVLAAVVAWRNWRRTVHEQAGGGHELLASGTGRTRFLAMAGLLTCAVMALAIVYIGAGHALLQECGL